MKLSVNGEVKELDGLEISVAHALELLNVESPDMVSVQLNQEFVEKDDYNSILLKENDEIEFLYFMGGGAS